MARGGGGGGGGGAPHLVAVVVVVVVVWAVVSKGGKGHAILDHRRKPDNIINSHITYTSLST